MFRIDSPIIRGAIAVAILTVSCLFPVAAWAGKQIPGAAQEGPIALQHATIFPISQPQLQNATIVFDGGKIVAVGPDRDVVLPPNARTFDLTGKSVFPGLFESHSQMGLIEIGQVRATDDRRETGALNPNVKAQVAVNPDSEVIPVTRSNGVLLALSAPDGGLVSGRSAVLQLDGWTYEDLTLKAEVAMQIEWPSFRPPRRGDAEARKKAKEEQQKALQDLHDLFTNAKTYAAAKRNSSGDQSYDARLEAMIPVVEGQLPIMVRADDLAQIESAVGFASQQGVRLILLGGYDAPMCAELLQRHQVPVIVSAVYRLPRRAHDPYDHAYTLPKRLLDANIPFCISGTDRSETWNARLLPYHAGTAVAYGLPREEALKAITLYPAQILGVADRVGSLEAGKDATLIVTDGDPLETTTEIEMAFVQGRAVDLSNRQTRLFEKYREKYRRLADPTGPATGD
jgi:imidazolonepropionase-like amidohydrolase